MVNFEENESDEVFEINILNVEYTDDAYYDDIQKIAAKIPYLNE